MPQPAEFDLSTPLLHPYQPPSPSYRPPAPPPPAAPQPVRRKALSKPAKGVIFVLVSSLIFGVILLVVLVALNAQDIASAQAMIAGGGTVSFPSGVTVDTEAELSAYLRKEIARFVLAVILAYYGVAILMLALAGAKGKFR